MPSQCLVYLSETVFHKFYDKVIYTRSKDNLELHPRTA